jgi:hypothetical protein
MHDRNYRLTIAVLCGILSGLYLAIIAKKIFSFSINPNIGFEINPFELFSIATNIILAIYIARTLSKRNDIEKTEKDLLIEYFKDYKKDFTNKINTLLNQGEFISPKTNSDFKVLRKRLKVLIGLSNEYNFIPVNDELTNLASDIVKSVWQSFTDIPRATTDDVPAEIRSDLERIRVEKINSIEVNTIELDKVIFNIIIKINRK